jgi:ADP-ribose pyrophosphatase
VDYLDAGRRSVRKDFIEHPGAVTVIPEEEDGSILLVRVGRIAVDRFLLEFCAGKLEPGEDPKAAAGRELEEEVGRRAERIRPIASFLTSPGCSDEHLHVFHASGLRTIPTRLEPGEEIEVVRMRPEEIEDAMLDGRIEDGKTIAAWHLFQLQKRASKEGS